MMSHAPDEHHKSEQIYLRVAEAVLGAARSPLSAREIVERGIERGLFGDHVLSQTPEKSMQARLSLDIKGRRETSSFMRVARGRFLLRSHSNATSTVFESLGSNGISLAEYIAEPRILGLPTESVLCAMEKEFLPILTFQGIDGDHATIIRSLLRKTTYVDRSLAEDQNDAKQFITYVLVQCGHRLLSFERSYLSRAAEFLRGSKCIGFGGHVSAADNNIFSPGDLGLEYCARRELSEELHVSALGPHRATKLELNITQQLFRDAPLECLGVLNDDSSEVGRRHLAVVYRIWIPDWSVARLLRKGEASVRSLSWIDLTKDKIDITQYEYWSQLCLRKSYSSNIVSKPVIRHRSPRITRTARTLVISGRVGSGKSETSRFLAQRLGAEMINSGKVLQELMSAPEISEIGRVEFQRRAEEFIRATNGPAILGKALAEKVTADSSKRVVIDGVRQIETLSSLTVNIDEAPSLLYVHTPPDIAFEMYRLSESTNSLNYTYRTFLDIYDAPVESDLPSLGRSAQTYLYNFLGMEALRRSLEALVDDLD